MQNTLDKFTQPICSMVKFPTDGWTNISLFWLAGLPSCAFFLWFGSIQLEEKLIMVWFYLKMVKQLLVSSMIPFIYSEKCPKIE
jgi:hypothetical protein